MRGLGLAIGMAAMIGLGGSAQATISYYSVGAVTDSYGTHDIAAVATDTAITSFDGSDVVLPNARYMTGTSRPTGYVGSPLSPAGDLSTYMSVAAGGTVLFDLRSYLQTNTVRGISFYVGSIDAGNKFELLSQDSNYNLNLTTPLLTLMGTDMTTGLDKTGAAANNRRVYINFDTIGNIGALRFSSTDGSLEFDTIRVSTKSYTPPTTAVVQQAAQIANSGSLNSGGFSSYISGVPEPTSWATVTIGFGLLGGVVRTGRRKRMAVG